MRCAPGDFASASAPNKAIIGRATSNREVEGIVFEHNERRAVGPPAGGHFEQAAGKAVGIENAAIKQNRVGTRESIPRIRLAKRFETAGGVLLQESSEMARNRGIGDVRQAHILNAAARGFFRKIG